ncbi:MAG: alpha/beta hydrolase [Chloroflexi bacterium]|nr:alpha/beta hydrolase [Chloroflexota bacterium]MCY3686294.1 alpha/beta hydrolase [Chloroflexota bacterium]MDE2708915.1 alpha/beta hydrolase [Chloroflexota bacterium]
MPPTPETQGLLAMLEEAGGPDISEQTPEEARVAIAGFAAMQAGAPEPARVEDRTVPGPAGDIPIRVYASEGDNLPVVMYFHGGGWVLGDIESHDGTCKQLLAELGDAVVVSVHYRLAPEDKYPAAADDCYAAAAWVAENGGQIGADGSRMAVCGDSAGGNLSAVVSQMARDKGGPAIAAQVLHVPVTDHNYSYPSYTENAEGMLLTRDSMVWFWDHYLPNAEAGQEAYASPIKAADLSGLAPALIQTAEFDPLRDEGEAYGAAIEAAGGDVTVHRYDGVVHDPFMMFAVIPTGIECLKEAAAYINDRI